MWLFCLICNQCNQTKAGMKCSLVPVLYHVAYTCIWEDRESDIWLGVEDLQKRTPQFLSLNFDPYLARPVEK